jgi:PIN domain nuclease of toxin-antitoxin system
MILLDTHAWIWLLSSPHKLSSHAKEHIDSAVVNQQVYVSSISVWEMAMLVNKGRLLLTMHAEDWIDTAEKLPFLHFVPIDNGIAFQSVNLPGNIHNDPADRIIVATAIKLKVPIISKDRRIRDYPHVPSVW